MPALQVKDVDPELHRRLRERARDERMTLGEYVTAVLERDLARPSRREWSERVAAREPLEVNTVDAIAKGRAERDAEIAAPGRR